MRRMVPGVRMRVGLLVTLAALVPLLLLNLEGAEAKTHAAAAKPARAAYPLISIVRARRGQVYIRTFAGLTNTKKPTYWLTGPGDLVVPRTTAKGDRYIGFLDAKGRWTHFEVACVGGGSVTVLKGRSVVFVNKPCTGGGTFGTGYLSSDLRDLRARGRWHIQAPRRTVWIVVAIADSQSSDPPSSR